MYHMVHINPTLLDRTNDDTKNVCEKNRPISKVINVWRQCIQVKHIILPIFGKENKLSIQIRQKGCDFREKIRKNRWVSPTISNRFDNFLWKIVRLKS